MSNVNSEPQFMGPDENFDKRINRLKEIINECSGSIAFIGGAGVSTGSGIPDFRSKDGLYNKIDPEFAKYKPENLLSHGYYVHKPKIFYKFYRNFLDTRKYEPCTVHNKLAQMERDGVLMGVITQNIDMLHEKAGTKNIMKIHGTSGTNHCVRCNATYDWDWFFDNEDMIPRCSCGGQVRPDVVLYGENLPMDAYTKAIQTVANARCLIVAGTALMVGSATNLVSQFTGEYLIIINNQPTPFDEWADICFREDMNDVFALI